MMPFLLSMDGCLRDGETITGRIAGMGMIGVMKEYLTGSFNRFISEIIVNNPGPNTEWGRSLPDRSGIRRIGPLTREGRSRETRADPINPDRNLSAGRAPNNPDLRMEDPKGEGDLRG